MNRKNVCLILLLFAALMVACSSPPDPTATPVEDDTEPLPTETAVPATATTEPSPSPQPSATPQPAAETVEETTAESEEAPEAVAAASELAEAGLLIDDEGGPVSITGLVTYTNPFFTAGVAEPLVILEDQAGFVDRNESFLLPPQSQVLGQITSDFYTSPFSYSIALPIEPQGSLRDVDNDDEEDEGLQIYAIAYWTNIFGDPFLEERDLSGGGWSTAYASTRISEDAATKREVVGGKLLIYAPDDEQGFPTGFGEDGLLFTEDDPTITVPAGYTVVDLDSDPFTFDRSQEQEIDLIEPEGTALVDLSDLSYPQAFDELVDKLSKEYAFTEYKSIDWDSLHEEFRPRFEEAQEEDSTLGYRRALRDFAWSIPDGHVGGPSIIEDFQEATSGGLGIAIRELDDGRVIVNFLLPNSPADEAGMELGTEILEINGTPIAEAISETIAFSAPFSTDHFRRLQQLRYVTRFPLGTEVEVTFRAPGSSDTQTVTLETIPEQESFSFSSFNVGRTGFELPVEYEILEESGLGYVKIYSFFDNELLTVQLWERMMRSLNQAGVPGLIIDLRQNGGGRGFLADQMAAYFFNEPLKLGNTGQYDEESGEFFFDPRSEQQFYPPAEELRYDGKVAVIIGPNCLSACEFFTYDMTLQDRAAIVGHYPTGGLGGSIERVLMPENEFFTFTSGRAVDANGEIHIEGKGVAPTVEVPVTEETLLGQGDPLLEAAVDHLAEATTFDVIDGGDIAIGDTVTGELEPGVRLRYTLSLSEGDFISIYLEGESDELDPILGVYSEDGELLGGNDNASEETRNAAIEEVEIPGDLVLILEAADVGDDAQGEFTLRVVDAGG